MFSHAEHNKTENKKRFTHFNRRRYEACRPTLTKARP